MNKMGQASTVIVADGVYTLPGTSLIMGADSATIQAAAGAKPVITSSDGKPPYISLVSGTTLDGLWFGGTHDATADRPINLAPDVIIQNCTFFNYNQCLNVADTPRLQVLNNRFVNCGNDRFQHSIYITTPAGSAADGVLVQGNILIGGEGYHITLWHEPAYASIINNFFGAARWALSVKGDHHTVQRNILWSATGYAPELLGQYIAYGPTNLTYDHNIINVITFNNEPDYPPGMDSNIFVDGHNEFGSNITEWALTDVLPNLGISNADLDTAVSTLQTSFMADITTIRADATIETNFALLVGALAAV